MLFFWAPILGHLSLDYYMKDSLSGLSLPIIHATLTILLTLHPNNNPPQHERDRLLVTSVIHNHYCNTKCSKCEICNQIMPIKHFVSAILEGNDRIKIAVLTVLKRCFHTPPFPCQSGVHFVTSPIALKPYFKCNGLWSAFQWKINCILEKTLLQLPLGKMRRGRLDNF